MKTGLFFVLLLSITNTAIAKDLLPAMLQNMSQGKLTYEMAEIVAEKISYLSFFKEAYDKANRYSVEICGVKSNKRHSRDEVDAVRHFIGASILSSVLGNEYVNRLLTAHEKRRESFNDENYMDISNNQLGINFGTTIPYVEVVKKVRKRGHWRKQRVMKRDHSLAFFRTEIQQRIKSGKLFTLESGKSLCANPNVFPNM